MSAWLNRVGKHGEFQQEFLSTDRICLTWDILQETDLSGVKNFADLRAIMVKLLPNASVAKVSNHASQIFIFLTKMKPGDAVVAPLFGRAAVAIGEITGPYHFDPNCKFMYRHSRPVRWISTDMPRSRFDADLRQSLSGMKTIFEIKVRDAERRIRAMVSQGGSAAPLTLATHAGAVKDEDNIAAEVEIDLERRAYDDIAELILRKFKGRRLERLIEGILAAQGYQTYRSPEGPDKGVDLLAAPGPLGFGSPRICVQVKCTEGPVDHPTLSQLLGTMQNVKAQQGLLVSWGGFKSSVDKVRADHFFTVRLWDQDDVIRELLASYEKLDEDIRAEIPLKRIWIASPSDEE